MPDQAEPKFFVSLWKIAQLILDLNQHSDS